jgi:hypothetical protein
MNATHSPRTSTPQPATLYVLAHLMERLDRSAEPVGADQYRAVARQLGDALAAIEPGIVLNLLLQHSPSAAEMYENQQYSHAGLCRHPLDAALESERLARDVIEKARHTPGFTNRGPSSGKE